MVKDAAVSTVARWVVVAAVTGNIGIALGAFWLSFTALSDLAGLAGIPSAEAWVWPLIVDGMIVVATISVVALSPHGRRAIVYPWGLLIAGTTVSVAANVAHSWVVADASVSKPLAACVSAIPPIVLLASTHLTVDLTRRSRVEVGIPSGAHTADATVTEHVRPSVETVFTVADPRAAAAELRGAGWSNRRIARELNVHPSTVGRWLPAGLENIGGAHASANAEEQGALSAQ
jgi:hypothetical protein